MARDERAIVNGYGCGDITDMSFTTERRLPTMKLLRGLYANHLGHKR